MKDFIKFCIKALTFTIGMALTLISLCFLIKFYENGLNFDNDEIWTFTMFFLTGFPTLIFGINQLSEKRTHSTQ
jgi:hypothetical protein